MSPLLVSMSPLLPCRPYFHVALTSMSPYSLQVRLDKETYPESTSAGRGLIATRDIPERQEMFDVWRFTGNKPDVCIVDSFRHVPENKKRYAFAYHGTECVHPRSLRKLGFGFLANHEQTEFNTKGRILPNAFAMEGRGRKIFAMTTTRAIPDTHEVTMQCFNGRPNGKRYPDVNKVALAMSTCHVTKVSPAISASVSYVALAMSPLPCRPCHPWATALVQRLVRTDC